MPESTALGIELEVSDSSSKTVTAATPPESLESLIELLRDAYRNVVDDDGPWVMLGKLSSNLHANHSIEDSGYRALTETLRPAGEFHQSEAGGSKSFKLAEAR